MKCMFLFWIFWIESLVKNIFETSGELDRERNKLQRTEAKITMDIKAAAKKNQMG